MPENLTAVANLSLDALGEPYLTDYATDTGTTADAVRLLLPHAIQTVLESHQWSFATRTATLAASITTDTQATLAVDGMTVANALSVSGMLPEDYPTPLYPAGTKDGKDSWSSDGQPFEVPLDGRWTLCWEPVGGYWLLGRQSIESTVPIAINPDTGDFPPPTGWEIQPWNGYTGTLALATATATLAATAVPIGAAGNAVTMEVVGGNALSATATDTDITLTVPVGMSVPDGLSSYVTESGETPAYLMETQVNSRPAYSTNGTDTPGAGELYLHWTGTAWNIHGYLSGSVSLIASSSEDVATPDLVTTWSNAA